MKPLVPKYRVIYSKDLNCYAVLNNSTLKVVSEYSDKFRAEKTCKALNIRLNVLKSIYSALQTKKLAGGN